MKIDDASKFFGSDAALARDLGFPYQSTVSNWRRKGPLVPELYARRLADRYGDEKRNGVVLKFRPSLYRLAS